MQTNTVLLLPCIFFRARNAESRCLSQHCLLSSNCTAVHPPFHHALCASFLHCKHVLGSQHWSAGNTASSMCSMLHRIALPISAFVY